MQKLKTTTALISLVLAAGCATSTDEIVQIGADTYKVANLDRFADYSSSALKSRMYQDAYKHCSAKNRLMVPENNGDQSPASATSAPAGLHFRCVTRSEAHAPKTPAL